MTAAGVERRHLIAGLGAALVPLPAAAAPPSLAEPTTGFSAPIGMLPFGTHSHWLQPWRPLARTRSAHAIAAGIGTVLRDPDASPAALAVLARHGIRHVRVELGWNLVDYDTESTLNDQPAIETLLRRLRDLGMRPLILLNAHHGAPGPHRFTHTTMAADSPAGARHLTVFEAHGLQPGLSGIQGFGAQGLDAMAAVLVTAIAATPLGVRLSLSRPLPRALSAGDVLRIATLRYAPFAAPGTLGFDATAAGWIRYVALIARTAAAALGTRHGSDRGFDLEVWNELTFGSDFLDIANSYDPPPSPPTNGGVPAALLAATAAHVAATPELYAGVRISDGFASTIPWPAAATLPARIGALSKHPYPPDLRFPADEQRGPALDAQGQPTRAVPAYRCLFAEYIATGIQTETIVRDITDVANDIGDIAHGRLSRSVGGVMLPVNVWITEIGLSAAAAHIADSGSAARFRTAAVLRALFFYLCIGVERVYWFEAFDTQSDMGLASAVSGRPTPALSALGRMLAAIAEGAVPIAAADIVPLVLTVLPSPSGPLLFAAGATPGTPALTCADSLALLPLQRGPRGYAVVFYLINRDMRAAVQASLRVRLAGPAGIPRLRAYDPVQQSFTPLPIDVDRCIALPATDVPAVLLVDYA